MDKEELAPFLEGKGREEGVAERLGEGLMEEVLDLYASACNSMYIDGVGNTPGG